MAIQPAGARAAIGTAYVEESRSGCLASSPEEIARRRSDRRFT